MSENESTRRRQVRSVYIMRKSEDAALLCSTPTAGFLRQRAVFTEGGKWKERQRKGRKRRSRWGRTQAPKNSLTCKCVLEPGASKRALTHFFPPPLGLREVICKLLRGVIK